MPPIAHRDSGSPDNDNRIDRRKSRRPAPWILVSFTLSTCLLAWVFSSPFRSSNTVLATNPEEDSAVSSVISQGADRARNAAIVQEAIERDRQFMESLRAKRQAEMSKVLPDNEVVKQKWLRHDRWVQKQVRELSGAKEGSLAWQYRQDLIRTARDDVPAR